MKFKCFEHGVFNTKDYYDNPCFLADKVADCPTCGRKCWKKPYGE